MPLYNERRDGGWVDQLKPLKSTTFVDEIYNAIVMPPARGFHNESKKKRKKIKTQNGYYG